MRERVWNYIKEYGLLEPGDRVVAALSGGADSVCLLSVLKELGLYELRALHVHHGLRGEEADRDADFVRELCEKLQVPFEIVYYDVAGYAREHGLSTEEAGRNLRYEALEAAARKWEEEASYSRNGTSCVRNKTAVKIAVAHHRDDNAETILHHLLRGSGLRGLGGIAPVQGRRVRPLLCVGREEIRAYLRKKGQTWCEDSTNESADYTRNRIRNELIPYMTEHINARASENILRAGEIFAQADQYLEKQAEGLWKQAGRVEEEADESGNVYVAAVSLDRELFLAQETIIRTYLLRRMIELAAPGQKDITARHYAQLERLAAQQAGKRCSLPGGLSAVRDYQVLRLERCIGKAEEEIKEQIVRLPVPGEPPVWAGELQFEAFSRLKDAEIPKNQYTKWFDYAKIKDTLFVRTRRQGDYLSLPDGRHKALQRYMIDEKIPRDRRDRAVLLAEGSHILWLIGYRISEYYKISENTQTILQVTFHGGKEHGR